MANGSDDKLVIEAAGLGFDNLVRDLNGLQRELDETSERAKKVDADPIEIDTSEARRRIEALQADFRKFAETADDPILIKARTQQAQKELREVNRHLSQVRKAARLARKEVVSIEKGAKSVRSLNSSLKNAAGAAQSFVGNLAAVAVDRFFGALKDGIVSAVKVKATLEGLDPALRNVAGGYDGAAKATEFLKGASDRLARPINELVPGFIKLAGATKGTAAEGKLTQDVFENMLSAANALGVETQQLEGAMVGLSQVAGRDLLKDLTDVRQVTDAMPGVMQAWADAMGVTQSELRDLISGGTIPTEMALRKLNEAFENIGSGAAEERLSTLAGKFAILKKESTETGQTFANELTPGLKELLDRLIRMSEGAGLAASALGEIASVELSAAADDLRQLDLLFESIGFSMKEMAEKSPFREVLADALKLLPGMRPFGTALDAFGDRLEGLPEKGAKAFDKIVSDAVLASQGITDSTSEAAESAAQDFLGLSEKASESFRKQAEAAGVSAEVIEKVEQDLAADLVRINDATAKQRESIRELRIQAEREQVGDIEKIEEALGKAVVAIVERTEKQRAEAVKMRIQDAKDGAVEEKKLAEEQERRIREITRAAAEAAEERVDAERQAEDAIEAARTATSDATLEAFRTFTETAVASADERREAEEALSDDLVRIETELSEKKAEALEAFAEKVKKSGGDREKLEADLSGKLVDLEVEANRKREELLQRRLAAVEKAADEEIRQLERVKRAQEDLAKSLDDLFDESEKASKAGEGGDKGARKLPVEEAIESVREDVEALRTELDGLQFGGEGAGLDPDRILEVGRAYDQATVGVGDFADGTETARSEYEDATAAMRENAEQLGEKIRELVTKNEAFAEVFPTLSEASQSAIGAIVRDFGNLDEGAQLSKESVEEVEDQLRKLLTTSDDAGSGAETLAGRLADLAGESDGVTEASERSAEAIRRAADGIKFSGEATDKAREGLERWKDEARDAADEVEGAGEQAADAADGIKAGGEAAAEASEGVGQLGEVAGEAAEGVGAVADAAERLQEVELPPELPEQLAAIGEAATVTSESAGPLGESLALVTTQLAEIQVSVEALAAAAPELNTLLAEGGEKLAEIAEAETLKTISEQVGTLRENLDGVGPLVEQVATALTTIGEQGQPVADSAELIRDALAELGSEDTVGKVQAIVEALRELPEPLEKSATSSGQLAENVGKLSELADQAKDALEGLIAIFGEKLPESIKATADAIGNVRGEVTGLRRDAQDAAQAITDGMSEAREVIQGATQDMRAYAAATRDAAAAQRELNEAMNEANAEEG